MFQKSSQISATLPLSLSLFVFIFIFHKLLRPMVGASVSLCWETSQEKAEQSNSVNFNGHKNTTNGVHHHHLIYLIIYLFRQFSEILWLNLSFMGPSQPLDMQFQSSSRIWYQFNAHVGKSLKYSIFRMILKILFHRSVVIAAIDYRTT